MMEPGQMSKVKQRIQLQNHLKKHRLLDYIRNSVLFHITTLKTSLFWLDLLDLYSGLSKREQQVSNSHGASLV